MKLLVVTCRFGKKIIGGAEKLAWEISHRLKTDFDIEVLTTCAKDYKTWSNYYPAGKSRIDDLIVHRYPVANERHWRRFGVFSGLVFRWNRLIGTPWFFERFWLKSQGPYCPDLIRFLKDENDRFDRILFVSYLYFPTVDGLPLVNEKSVLIPTAHDEAALGLKIYSSVFNLPRTIVFMSNEERDLVHSRFRNARIPCEVIGVGVQNQPIVETNRDYFMFAGRIELGKNCPEMFDYCYKSGINLKVIGTSKINIPPHVEFLGYVSSEEKHTLLSGCKAVIIPSKNESFSILALEAWSHGKPVIVHSDSPVLVGHVTRSGGGYTYQDAQEFDHVTKNINPEKGKAGREYVKANYTWDKLIPKYADVLTW